MSLLHEIDMGIRTLKERRKAPKEIEFEGQYGPVIGLYGYWGFWNNDDQSLLRYMANRQVSGTLANLDFFTKGIDHYLPVLDEKINKHPNSYILGYSAGGALALRWAQLNGWENFDKIITVGSPLAGLEWYLKFGGKTASDLNKKSTLLRGLLELQPPKDKVLSLFGKEDYFTPNPRGISLNWPSAVIDANGHSEILTNNYLLEFVLDSELGIPCK